MFRWLPVFTVALFVLVALSSPAEQADAAVLNGSCTATYVQTENPGGVTNEWSTIGFSDFSLDISDMSFTLVGNPAFNIVGTAGVDGDLSGTGFGVYDGTSRFVNYTGQLLYWDEEDKLFFKGIIGSYAFDDLTTISSYCQFPVPVEIGDPDNDGIDSTVIIAGTYNVFGTGELQDGQNDLLVRLLDGTIQNVTLGNPSDFTLEFEKFGLANAIVERTTLNRSRTELIGVFYSTSYGNWNLPVELGGAVEQSIVSGYYRGSVKTDAAGTTILQDRFYSTGQIAPVDLLGGAATSGPATWKNSGRNVTTDFNPLTGEIKSSIKTKFFIENLAVAPLGPAVQGTALGDPLIFSEEVTGQFFPSGPLPVVDNCPDVANPGQEDSDQDGNGDACDGLIWLDGNCNGTVDARDMLRTLSGVAGVAVTPAPNCPDMGAP